MTQSKLIRQRSCTPVLRALMHMMVAVAAICLLGAARPANAQAEWPTKPIRLVLMLSAGGGADFVGRLIAERIAPRLGQPVVVENRTGAGGNIGTQHVARSAPDGYTFLLTTNSHTLNPFLYRDAGYDALNDFMPVIQVCEGPLVLATSPKFPYRTVKDVVEAAKAKPGSLAFGTSGIGSSPHIAVELLKQAAGVELIHVPYKGAAQSVQDALGGQMPLLMAALGPVAPYIPSQKLHVLGITGAKRWPSEPNIPTFAEQGYPIQQMAWLGILAPRGTPPALVERMNREIAAVLSQTAVRDRMLAQQWLATGGSAADFATMLSTDLDVNRKLVARLGLKAE